MGFVQICSKGLMAAAVLEVLARAAVVVAGPAPQCAATAWQVVMGHLALGTDAAAGCRVGCVLGSPAAAKVAVLRLGLV